MMANLKIVTDSSSTMEPSVRDALAIHVVPLSVMIDGVVYPDDETLPGEKFMQMMAQTKELPKTSQPPIGHFVELYDELGKDGSEILSIHMTKGLSGTVEAARQASHLSKAKVTVLPEVDLVREHTKLFIGVSTLENLVKGGRISRAKGLLSSLLNMKVIMDFDHSELIPVVKGRGVKTFNKWFEELKAELKNMPKVTKIGISHAEGLEITERFQKELAELFPDLEIPLLHTTPIIATHTGRGAFAITYSTE